LWHSQLIALENLFSGWFEAALGLTGSLTLLQLCQNYLLLYVRIGKMKVTAPVLNA